MDHSKVTGPQGNIWSHQVVVVVPKNLKSTNVSFAWITDGCNSHPNEVQTAFSNYNTLIVDELAHNTGSITVSIMQVPNCPLKFPSDPTHRGRGNDALLAYSWKEFLDHSDDPNWLVWLPMVKGSYQSMKAVQEFLKEKNIANIEGWVVSGASKRGWTSYLVAATRCSSCGVNLLALAPAVPIVPNIT